MPKCVRREIPSDVQTILSQYFHHKADNSTWPVQGLYATKVLSFENEPGLKQLIPVYLNAFCSLLSPNTICERNKHNFKINIFKTHISLRVVRRLNCIFRTTQRKNYRVRSWIEVETVIVIPDNWLNSQREGTEMALMCYSSYKLQRFCILALETLDNIKWRIELGI